MPSVSVRATYDLTSWPSDEPDTEPDIEGGFRAAIPDKVYGDAFEPWVADNVETVTLPGIYSAAEFVAEFPGGVWDLSESEPETVDYGTGETMAVTLHVMDHEVAVFELAEQIMAAKDARLAAMVRRAS